MEQVSIPQSGKKKRPFTALLITLGVVLLAAACVFLSNLGLFGVEGRAMEPTLPHGTCVIAWKLGYQPRQGDIIVFHQPYDNVDMLMVKRVIAVGGQTVDIDYAAGTVSVDGEVLNEPYINTEPMREPWLKGLSAVAVPEGSVFVMGDNRNHSSDSRDPRLGCIELGNIKGKVIWSFRLS